MSAFMSDRTPKDRRYFRLQMLVYDILAAGDCGKLALPRMVDGFVDAILALDVEAASPTGRQLGPGKRDELPPIVSEGVGGKSMPRPDLDAMEAVAHEWAEALRDNGHCGEGTLERNQRQRRVDAAELAVWAACRPETLASLLAYIRELEGALTDAAKRMDNARRHIESGQVVDKDVHGDLVRGRDAARSALSKATGEGG